MYLHCSSILRFISLSLLFAFSLFLKNYYYCFKLLSAQGLPAFYSSNPFPSSRRGGQVTGWCLVVGLNHSSPFLVFTTGLEGWSSNGQSKSEGFVSVSSCRSQCCLPRSLYLSHTTLGSVLYLLEAAVGSCSLWGPAVISIV